MDKNNSAIFGHECAPAWKSMGVAASRISRIQRDEVTGATTLRTLQQTAAAMDCAFVYALVPAKSLDATLVERATQKALLATDLDEEQDRMVAHSTFVSPRGVWDDG